MVPVGGYRYVGYERSGTMTVHYGAEAPLKSKVTEEHPGSGSSPESTIRETLMGPDNPPSLLRSVVALVKHPSLAMILGLAVGISYALGALLASRYYPATYSPLHNTLSQLGNVNLNPGGAIYYLTGCAVSGLFTIAFFLSLAPWRQTGAFVQNRFLLAVQVLGVFGGIGLVLNALFPENHLTMHHIAAGIVFNALGVALLLSPLAFWRRGRHNLTLAGVSLIGCAAVVVMFAFARNHFFEWLPVSLFLILPGLLGFRTRIMARLPHRRHDS